jgi:6-pyruvoyl-tetrahydropterin synthase
MMKISLFYDHVTVLDYAYLDYHRGLVGDAVVVNVEFIGRTDDDGVVFDFSRAKKKVKEIIDRDCDHRLVIPKNIANYNDDQFTLQFKYGLNDEVIEYKGPAQALCELPYAHVSKQNLIAHLEQLVLEEMPETVEAVKLDFISEELTEKDTFFNYTHGLKKHYGNCQRLMHGHRSALKILINGQRDYAMEKDFAENIFAGNIHFCTWENVVNQDEIKDIAKLELPVGRFAEVPSVHIKYDGNQGTFEGKLPEKKFISLMTNLMLKTSQFTSVRK